MTTSESPVTYSPLLIGFMLSTFMYGTTLGQAIYYFFSFPDDSRIIKTLALIVSLTNTGSVIGGCQFFWTFFVLCHASETWSCEHDLPWGGLVMECLNAITIFIVQCFYCRRIWIISGKNKILTLIILLLIVVGITSTIWYTVRVIRIETIQFFFGSPIMLPFFASDILYDILITSSIFKYMWRSGFRRRRSIIQDMAVVCINMGAFTCVLSLIAGVMFFVQGTGYWVASVCMVISHSYVNSMLAVLNARKALRERDPNVYELSLM